MPIRALLVFLIACGGTSAPPQQAPAPPAAPAPAPAGDASCAMHPDGWCPSPAGDPCRAHKDVASCKADAHCGGMSYKGESLVACKRDDRNFGINCPTVGCVSLAK